MTQVDNCCLRPSFWFSCTSVPCDCFCEAGYWSNPPSPPLPADVSLSADREGYRPHRIGSRDNLTFELLFAISFPRESRTTRVAATLWEKLMLLKPNPYILRRRPVSVTTMAMTSALCCCGNTNFKFHRSLLRELLIEGFLQFLPYSRLQDSAVHRSWLRKTRGGSLYFCLACFRYVPTISEPDTGKRFSENKHTLHWHKAKYVHQ